MLFNFTIFFLNIYKCKNNDKHRLIHPSYGRHYKKFRIITDQELFDNFGVKYSHLGAKHLEKIYEKVGGYSDEEKENLFANLAYKIKYNTSYRLSMVILERSEILFQNLEATIEKFAFFHNKKSFSCIEDLKKFLPEKIVVKLIKYSTENYEEVLYSWYLSLIGKSTIYFRSNYTELHVYTNLSVEKHDFKENIVIFFCSDRKYVKIKRIEINNNNLNVKINDNNIFYWTKLQNFESRKINIKNLKNIFDEKKICFECLLKIYKIKEFLNYAETIDIFGNFDEVLLRIKAFYCLK